MIIVVAIRRATLSMLIILTSNDKIAMLHINEVSITIVKSDNCEANSLDGH